MHIGFMAAIAVSTAGAEMLIHGLDILPGANGLDKLNKRRLKNAS